MSEGVAGRKRKKRKRWRNKKPPWTRTIWPGETPSNRGLYSWEVSSYIPISAQSRLMACKPNTWIVSFIRASWDYKFLLHWPKYMNNTNKVCHNQLHRSLRQAWGSRRRQENRSAHQQGAAIGREGRTGARVRDRKQKPGLHPCQPCGLSTGNASLPFDLV